MSESDGENQFNIHYSDRSYRLDRRLVRALFELVLKKENRHGSLINIIFVDDSSIRKLNRRYLGENRITDVLSFNFDDDLLGEIYICLPQARRQAMRNGCTIKSEILGLLIHGLLHLLGYDHNVKKVRREMIGKQESYLNMVAGI